MFLIYLFSSTFFSTLTALKPDLKIILKTVPCPHLKKKKKSKMNAVPTPTLIPGQANWEGKEKGEGDDSVNQWHNSVA